MEVEGPWYNTLVSREPTVQGIQSGSSIHAMHLLTSSLFTVNAMWTNQNVLSKM